MAESSLVPHGRTGSSFTPKSVAPYTYLPLTVIKICRHDGKGPKSREERPHDLDCTKKDPRLSSTEEGREALGPPEVVDLLSRDSGHFP
ncbi:hypothetical protein CDL15_Pgr027190 [Punica granatum]|uniref:Uncharacterized protein n=1 Tax=Punica granatum TaxID=22663 RepID=A0A218WIH9_PUNGR|nr:hypothetical protein CDL15_Pgr027190 [Punica granatum]